MRNGRVRAVLAVTAAAVVGLGGCDTLGGGGSSGTGTSAARAKPPAAPLWDTSPSSLAAVGDSITRGFDTCTILQDCPEASWATGSSTEVDSVAVRLLGTSRAATHSWNYAVTGARMEDLAAQMRRAAARKPQLVTVMAGSNDACRSSVSAMTPVAAFRTRFKKALSTLRAGAPKAQVYVASVPNLKRLWSQGRGNKVGRQVWKLGICPSMLRDPNSMAASATKRRDAVQDRVVEYNEVLKEVCAKDRRCRFDGGAVYDYRFGTKQLSHWDWFHPSKDGQARLAEIAYGRITRSSG